MKVYLDDERECLDGYVLAKTAQEAIDFLRTGNVTHISLDHDLGDNTNGTGYDVLCYIEEFMQSNTPIILIHTGNASARVKMELALKKINERAEAWANGN